MKNNCKYCNGERGNFSSTTLFQEKVLEIFHSDILASVDIFDDVDKGPGLLLTVGNSDRLVPIRYCPMCGRDLRGIEDESQKE